MTRKTDEATIARTPVNKAYLIYYMKIRSIHRLNNRIRNYLCLFLVIFIASSLGSTILFSWSVSKEVNGKASTWANHLVERISFLETVVTSRATFDHGLSILRVTPEGEVVNTRPFPIEIKSIAELPIFQKVKNFEPGQSLIIKHTDGDNSGIERIFLIQRLDHSFAIAKVPPESLLPVSPHNTELYINDRSDKQLYHTENSYFKDTYRIGKLFFSHFHVFASATADISDFGGLSITVAKDISTEFYAGILLLTFSALSLGLLAKRSAFLTWDLEKNEQDFIRINNLLKQVAAEPEVKHTHLSAIQHTAQLIRRVNWENEARRMSFIENRNYITATAFFSGKILNLLDEVSEHSHMLAQSRQEYRELMQTVRNIIDSMPSVVIGVDNQLRVTHFNTAAQNMAVIPVEKIEGSELEEAFPVLTKYAFSIAQAIENGTPETDVRTQGLSGPNSHQDVIIYPLNDGMKGAVIRIDDATERVQIDEMMIQTEKMMSIGGLAAGMAHEINNPLGGILQGIQNIIRRISPDLPANVKAADKAGCSIDSVVNYMEDRKIIKTLNGITDSGVRAASIVSGMLEFSRKSDSRKAPGDLRQIMDKAAKLAVQDYNSQSGYDFKTITMLKDYDQDLSMAPCTVTEIEQVFLNLLRNSAQAMSEWTEMAEKPTISIKISNKRDMVRCVVSDNGPGMDEQTRKRVFEPFYTTKAPGTGTGLGLSVSYFIITQNHGGSFHVDSNPGKGTTFTIQIPTLKN